MTLERKLLIAAGALILAFIIAVGFFSLGLYVGQYGLLPEAPSMAGPGGPPQQPGAGVQPPAGDPNRSPDPAERPPNLPSGPPDLVGRLRAINQQGLTIGAPQGPRQVLLDENTEVFDAQGESLSLGVLRVGASLAVFGSLRDDGRTMVANTIVVLPQPPNPPRPQQ
jgi:hypothetical protein